MNKKTSASTAPEIPSTSWSRAVTASRPPPAIVVISLARRSRVPHLYSLSWSIPDQPRPAYLTEAGRLLAEEVRARWPGWRDRGEVSRSAWLSTGNASGVLHRASEQATREALALVLLHLPEAEVRGADLLGDGVPG